jgi:hypothetical protein
MNDGCCQRFIRVVHIGHMAGGRTTNHTPDGLA